MTAETKTAIPDFKNTHLAVVSMDAAKDAIAKFQATVLDKADLTDDMRICRNKPLEDDFHVTLHIGIGQADAAITKILQDRIGPFEIELKGLGFFTNAPRAFDDEKGTKEEGTQHSWDVLYANIHCAQLAAVHKLLAEHYKVQWHHKTFSPHLTIAFLKQGRAAKYVQEANRLAPRTIKVNSILFRKYQERTAPQQTVLLWKSQDVIKKILEWCCPPAERIHHA